MATKAKTTKATKSDLSLTKVTPEAGTLSLTPEEQRQKEFAQTMKMFGASCDREIMRIKTENCVRIGDTILNERTACESFVVLLSKLSDKYLN